MPPPLLGLRLARLKGVNLQNSRVGRHSVNKICTCLLGEGTRSARTEAAWLVGADVLKCGEAVCGAGVSKLGRVP